MQRALGDDDRDRAASLPQSEGRNIIRTFSTRKLLARAQEAPGEGLHVGTCPLKQGLPSSHYPLEEELGVVTSSRQAVQLWGENKTSLDILAFGHAVWRDRKPRSCWPDPSGTGRSLTALLAPHPAAQVGSVLSCGFFVSAREVRACQPGREAC